MTETRLRRANVSHLRSAPFSPTTHCGRPVHAVNIWHAPTPLARMCLLCRRVDQRGEALTPTREADGK